MQKTSSRQEANGPRVQVRDIVAQLYADAETGERRPPRTPPPLKPLPQPAAAERYVAQRDARRAERAASRMMGVFEATATFLRDLRTSLQATTRRQPPHGHAPADASAPQQAVEADRTELQKVAAVVAAILLCWSVLLLRFDHTATATGFAVVGGALAWGALLRARRA